MENSIELAPLEFRALLMVSGRVPGKWGSAISVALESLKGKDLIYEHNDVYQLTNRGEAVLRETLES